MQNEETSLSARVQRWLVTLPDRKVTPGVLLAFLAFLAALTMAAAGIGYGVAALKIHQRQSSVRASSLGLRFVQACDERWRQHCDGTRFMPDDVELAPGARCRAPHALGDAVDPLLQRSA